MKYVLFTTDAEGRTVATVQEYRDAASLEEMQALVGGGYIEELFVATRSDGRRVLAIGNEDAIAKGMAPTVQVAGFVQAVSGVLRGPIIVTGVDDEGETRGLDDDEITSITEAGANDKSWPFFMGEA